MGFISRCQAHLELIRFSYTSYFVLNLGTFGSTEPCVCAALAQKEGMTGS
jgi:hypothetical protein